MSSILYYSNFCEHSKQLLPVLSKMNLQKEMHFICIDKRVKDANNKTFIVLENGQRIIMPENINRVPALLLLNKGYSVLYGEAIVQHFKPKQTAMVKQATRNNLEPTSFSFGGGGDIVSDQYSFLDMEPDSLKATGNGGARQMHNYVDLNFSDSMSTPVDETEYKKSSKMPEGLTVEQLQQQRDQELHKITGARPPMG
jgi:hypothetical protein